MLQVDRFFKSTSARPQIDLPGAVLTGSNKVNKDFKVKPKLIFVFVVIVCLEAALASFCRSRLPHRLQSSLGRPPALPGSG